MSGGPSPEQKAAAASQANLTNQTASQGAENNAAVNRRFGLIEPFATQRVNQGLPFYGNLTDATSGTTAQAFAPAHANLERTLATQPGLPNGFATQARTDLDAQQARAFDQGLVGNQLMNEQAKQQGAQMLTGQAQVLSPLQWFQAGMQGNQSIMQAPLQKPGLGGLIGGIAGGALHAAMA